MKVYCFSLVVCAPFDYDQITVAAQEQGSINAQINRGTASFLIHQYHKESNFTDLPQTCFPDSTVNRLYTLSVAMEQRLFGTRVAEFEADAFCRVDVDTVLADPAWRSFVQSMLPPP
jgi:hypothetical protein